MPRVTSFAIRRYQPGDFREARSIVAAGLMELLPIAFRRAAFSPSNVALVALACGVAYGLCGSLVCTALAGLAALGLIYLACWVLFVGYIREVLRTDMADIEGSYRREEGSGFWVAEEADGGGGLAGTVALLREPGHPGSCRLFRLSVRHTFRRRGVGEALLKEVLAFATAHGYQLCRLDTSVVQEPALGLYRKLGFRTVARGPASQSAILGHLSKITLIHLEKRL